MGLEVSAISPEVSPRLSISNKKLNLIGCMCNKFTNNRISYIRFLAESSKWPSITSEKVCHALNFFLSRTVGPAKAGIFARDRRALQ